MQNLNRALIEIDVMLPPKQYIERILQVTCDNLNYLFGTVIEVDNEGEAHMLTSYNLPEIYPELINKVEVPILSGPAGDAFKTGNIIVLHDPTEDPRLKPWRNLRLLVGSLETVIWVPLFKKGKVFGICVLYSDTRREISGQELSILEQVGLMISIAITSNQYLDKLTQRTKELEKEIAERKKAENILKKMYGELEIMVEERTAELSKANQKLQLFRDQINQSSDAIFIVDPQTALILDANEKACTSLGYNREELLSIKAMDFEMIFQDIDPWKDHVDKMRINSNLNKAGVGTHKRKDGTTFPVEVNSKLIIQDDMEYLLAIVRDITERKRAEKEIKLNEARLVALLKISRMKGATIKEITDFVVEEGTRLTESKFGSLNMVDEDKGVMNVISYSKNIMEQCNYDPQIEFIIKDTGLLAESIRQRKPVIINDYSAPHPNKKGYPEGHVPILRYFSIPLSDKGKIVVTAAVGNKEGEYNDSDVHQLTLLVSGMWEHIKRIGSEKELMDTKNYLDTIISMSLDGIFVIDDQGKYEFANEACYEMFGYTEEEFIGKPFMDFIPPDYTDFMLDKWHEIQVGEGEIYETVIINKDGTRRKLLISHTIIEINGQQKYCGIAKDITYDVTEYINTILETIKENSNE